MREKNCRAWFSILWLNSTGWIKSSNRKYCAQHGISASGVECLIEGLIHFSHKKLYRFRFFCNLVSGKSFLFSVVFIESLASLDPPAEIRKPLCAILRAQCWIQLSGIFTKFWLTSTQLNFDFWAEKITLTFTRIWLNNFPPNVKLRIWLLQTLRLTPWIKSTWINSNFLNKFPNIFALSCVKTSVVLDFHFSDWIQQVELSRRTENTAHNIVLAKCGRKYKVERFVKFIRRCFFVLIFFLNLTIRKKHRLRSV